MNGRNRLPPGVLPPGTIARYPFSSPPVPADAAINPLAMPPTGVYEPPPPPPFVQPPPVPIDQGVANGYETATQEFLCSEIPIVLAAGNAPLSIYATKQRWSAIDVYGLTDYAPVGDPTQAIISVGIYAVARGIRSLVATGRLRGGTLGLSAERIATARAVCDRFEVVAQRTNIVMADPDGMKVTLSVIASDVSDSESSIDPAGVGSIAGVPSGAGIIIVDTAASPNFLTLATPKALTGIQGSLLLTPVAIHAVNTAAAQRYIQLAATGAGTTLASFEIPSGGTLFVTDPTLLRRYRNQTIAFRQSSTPMANTASGDVNFNAWVR